MAEFECKVYRLRIEKHPNADALELAVVGDYRSIVRKGEFKTGDLGVYIPEAAIVPEWLIEELGLTGRLAGKQKNRVKAVKLRGILSQGLIYPANKVANAYVVQLEPSYDGDVKLYDPIVLAEDNINNLAELLGITKYEPVIPTSMNGEVFNAFGMTLKFDIENIKKFPNIFKDDELVFLTEKLHGTWCCFGHHPENDFPIVTSKGLSDKGLAFKFNEANESNLYVKMFKSVVASYSSDDLITRAKKFFPDTPFYILGEIFGAGVQDLTYGGMEKSFRVFDIYVGEPGKGNYVSPGAVMYVCKELELDVVPTLYAGPFSKEILAEFTDGKETASGQEAHIREGVVVRPVEERRDDEIGRVILKSVSEKYLLRKNATEYA